MKHNIYCKAIHIGVLFKLANLAELQKKRRIKYPPNCKILYKMNTDSMKAANSKATKMV